jgi:hypothetical protein
VKYRYSRPQEFSSLRGGLPLVEITLQHDTHEITIAALVDSGAAMSILPFDIGLQLGLIWEEQTVPVNVGGVLTNTDAYGVVVRGQLTPLPPLTLVFALISRTSDEVRTILGQMNFFHQFKITFEAYNNSFELTPLNDS